MREWLDTDGRIVIDDDVLDSESRAGKQIEVDRSDVDLAIESTLQAVANLLAVAIGMNIWRGDTQNDRRVRLGRG